MDVNGKEYYYRFYGHDYFGDLTEQYFAFKGSGYKKVRMAPIISYANQTEKNEADIEWKMADKYNEMIASYNVLNAKDIAGPYETIMENLPNDTRSLLIPMDGTQNYFVVEAVPKRGKPIPSTPVFVMGMDTIPPAVPEILDASIDSVGNVNLTWSSCPARDLWGYRIFRANFLHEEFSLMNDSLTHDTTFVDQVNLKFATDAIYYKIVSVDTRNNKSAPSEPVRIAKPDILPPSSPMITSIESKSDSVFVSWKKSSSEDVVLYHLYRKRLNDKTFNWTLIKTIGETDELEVLVDTDVNYGIAYAYTLVAFDDADLQSDPCPFKSIKVKKEEMEFIPIQEFEYSYDKETKKVTLTWELDRREELTEILVYKGVDPNKIGRYKFLDPNENSLVEEGSNSKDLYYFIKPLYKNQKKDYKSEIKHIVIAE